MTDIDIEDDLGNEWGSIDLPGAGFARESVLQWKILSLGRRPHDFMARDLLIAPWASDRRMWKFRKLRKNGARWAGRHALHLPHADRKLAIDQLVMQFIHKYHLWRLREAADDEEAAILERLWDCWPYGLQIAWRGAGAKSARDVCGLAHLCPFCLARKAVELYHCIGDGLLGTRLVRDGFLVLARSSVTDEDLDANKYIRAGRIRAVKRDIGQSLIEDLRFLGATGGLVTYQLGPHLSRTPVWHDYELDYESGPGLQYFVSAVGHLPARTAQLARLADNQPPLGSQIDLLGGSAAPTWAITGIDSEQAIRRILCGTNLAYRGHRCRGAFIVPSWPLATFEQWTWLSQEMRGVHLYDFWGSWRQEIPKCAPQNRQPAGFTNSRSRVGKRRRKIAFSAANQQRHAATADRRIRLLARIQETIGTSIAARNRSPGRTELQRILQGHGIDASDRDVRWLCDAIRMSNTTTQGENV